MSDPMSDLADFSISFDTRQKFWGGRASDFFPGTVESHFSVVKCEKDDYRSGLVFDWKASSTQDDTWRTVKMPLSMI